MRADNQPSVNDTMAAQARPENVSDELECINLMVIIQIYIFRGTGINILNIAICILLITIFYNFRLQLTTCLRIK